MAVLLRGPFLIAVAILSMALPYVLENISASFVAEFIVLCVGMALLLHDILALTNDAARRCLGGALSWIVIDDILRGIFDPQEGLIAMVVGCFMGSVAMYALPMTPKQRTRLVQATLLVDRNVARSVLFEPGGCKLLLPQSVQKWIRCDGGELICGAASRRVTATAAPCHAPRMLTAKRDQDSDGGAEDDGGSEMADSSSSITENNAIPSQSLSSSAGVPQELEDGDKSNPGEGPAESCSTDPPMSTFAAWSPANAEEDECKKHVDLDAKYLLDSCNDPVMVMIGILKDLIQERIRNVLMISINSTVPLGAIGIGSAAALACQLVRRKQFRRVAVGLLEGLCTASLFAVAAGSLSAIVLRHAALNESYERTALSSVPRRVKLVQICLSMTSSVCASVSSKWKTSVAFIVLTLIGRAKIKTR